MGRGEKEYFRWVHRHSRKISLYQYNNIGTPNINTFPYCSDQNLDNNQKHMCSYFFNFLKIQNMSQTTTPNSLSHADIYHFGLDELEIYAHFLRPEVLEWVDFDNSNYAIFDCFTITKHEVPRYVAKYLFTKDDNPLFSYYLWRWKNESQGVSTRNYVCFYGTSFRLLGSKTVFEIFQIYFKPIGDDPLRRFDICLDVTRDIWDILRTFYTIEQKWAIFMWADWDIETYNIGEKKSCNKRHFIRIYTKIPPKSYKNYLDFSLDRAKYCIMRVLVINTLFYENRHT